MALVVMNGCLAGEYEGGGCAFESSKWGMSSSSLGLQVGWRPLKIPFAMNWRHLSHAGRHPAYFSVHVEVRSVVLRLFLSVFGLVGGF